MRKYTFVLFLFLSLQGYSQLTGGKLQLAYDGNTDTYFMLLHITGGEAKTRQHRVQGNSQLTVVTPKNSTITVDKNYKPTPDTGKPLEWRLAASINNPAASPNNKFTSFGPNLSPTGFHDTLVAGDVVQLYSFTVNPKPAKFSDVRLFDKGIDPNSGAAGMAGADFSNSVVIGGAEIFEEIIGYGISSLSADSNPEDVKIYPNPVNELLQIKANSQPDKIIIKTINGNTVIDTKNVVIDMSSYLTGIYIIEVYFGNKKYSRKIIKN